MGLVAACVPDQHEGPTRVSRLGSLLEDIRACRVCAEALPAEPRPVLQAGRGARVLVIGQAPGRRVHESGVPWDDPSGDRLRDWLGLDRRSFYDPERVALVPIGFCYPGTGTGGDLPPRPECAPLWHERLLAQLPHIELSLLVGAHAQARYLDGTGGVTERVGAWRQEWPKLCPLPHPSPRNNRWLAKNPWFEEELVPELRCRVSALAG